MRDTEATYRKLLPASVLRVEDFPDATHSLVKHDVEQSELRLTLTAVLAPRALFASGFLAGQRRFLEHTDSGAGKGGRS